MIINEEIQNKHLKYNELKDMADIISEAFINHTNFVYTIKDAKRRKKALYNIFLMMYKIINRYGFISIVKEKEEVIGYITFMDSEDKSQISLLRVLKTRGLIHFFRFLFSLRLNELINLIKYNNTYNKYQKSEDKKSKIHLYSTGVKSDFRGKGLMGKAIRGTYLYFKKLGFKEMVLETADLGNIPIYEKLGFHIIETISTKDLKQSICFMAITL